MMRTVETYDEPALGTREEAVKAALKAHRSIERLRLSSREPSVTGKSLPAYTVWLLDVWRQVEALPAIEQTIVRRYFMLAHVNQATYGNRDIADELGLSERYVATLKRRAIDRITAALWPNLVA